MMGQDAGTQGWRPCMARAAGQQVSPLELSGQAYRKASGRLPLSAARSTTNCCSCVPLVCGSPISPLLANGTGIHIDAPAAHASGGVPGLPAHNMSADESLSCVPQADWFQSAACHCNVAASSTATCIRSLSCVVDSVHPARVGAGAPKNASANRRPTSLLNRGCIPPIKEGAVLANTASRSGRTAAFQRLAGGHAQLPSANALRFGAPEVLLMQGSRRLSMGSPRSYACARKVFGMAVLGKEP